MKTSSTALLATMAASSTPTAWAAAAATLRTTSGESDATKQSSKVATATTSSGSRFERGLSGKSGKSANALGLATPDDYQWILGNYKPYDSTLITLINGESDAGELPPPDIEGSRLEVKFLAFPGLPPNSSFEAKVSFSFLNEAGDRVFAREVYEGVGSYNTDFANQVTFYTDHLEFQASDGSWFRVGDEVASETGSLTCSKLPKVPSGSSIVCDTYVNDYFNINGGLQQEIIASTVWTEVTDESS